MKGKGRSELLQYFSLKTGDIHKQVTAEGVTCDDLLKCKEHSLSLTFLNDFFFFTQQMETLKLIS